MTSTEVAVQRKRAIRLPVGLLLSIGAEKPERGPGRAIDHFRPKDGQLGQYETEARRFDEHYGDQPKELRDVYFLASDVPAVLDIRLLAFSTSGIRGVGDTNFAEITDETEFEARVFGERSFTDGFTFFPKDVGEVRPELREQWEGEPIHGQLDGRNDPRVRKLDVKVVTSLEFCLPEIMGLGKVARISTSGRASTRNLYKALWAERAVFGGLEGISFRLAIRPRPTQRFVKEEKKYVQTTVYELVIDTPHTVAEIMRAVEAQRTAFGLPPRERLALEGQAFKQALGLPAPREEEEDTRDEPTAETPSWLLNKIAHIETELPEDARKAMLLGVFGVEQSADLEPDAAERYLQMLEAALPAEVVEGEVVDDENGEAAAPVVGAGNPEPGGEPGDTEASTQTGEGSGPSLATAGAGLGEDVPAPPDPVALPGEPLPGEPVAPADPVAIAAAGELAVPIGEGAKQRKSLGEMTPEWLEFALRESSRKFFTAYPEFYAGLELWTRERHPDVWEKVRDV